MDDTVLLCEFLARVFAAPPDADLIQRCREGAGNALLAALAGDDTLRPAIQTMFQTLMDPHGTDAIERAYTLLFSGVTGPQTVSLYASAHLDGRLFGNATARMEHVLAELDLSAVTGFNEPADHLSIQLAVLAELLRREDTTTARRFRDVQLCNWVPAFGDQCRARDPSGFYAGAATLLAAKICSETSVTTPAQAA